MEQDLTGAQSKVWKLIRNRRPEVNETCIPDTISKEEWIKYCNNIIYNKDDTKMHY